MSDEEMKVLARQGVKMTHIYFTDKEYLTMQGNQGIQQASEVCSEMLTDGFVINNVPALLALKEEV